MTMMLMREYALEEVDKLLADYLAAPEDPDYCYRSELNDIFRNECGLFVHLCTLEKDNGKLTAEVFVPDDEDPDEWVAAVDAYLEGRISLEPHVPEKLTVSMYVSTDPSAMEALQNALRDLRAHFMKGVASAIVADFAKKTAAKAGPPYRQLYQQRGSKGKRKRW